MNKLAKMYAPDLDAFVIVPADKAAAVRAAYRAWTETCPDGKATPGGGDDGLRAALKAVDAECRAARLGELVG